MVLLTFASIHEYSQHFHSLQWVMGPHGQSSQSEAALSLGLLCLQHSYQTVVLCQLLGEGRAETLKYGGKKNSIIIIIM